MSYYLDRGKLFPSRQYQLLKIFAAGVQDSVSLAANSGLTVKQAQAYLRRFWRGNWIYQVYKSGRRRVYRLAAPGVNRLRWLHQERPNDVE